MVVSVGIDVSKDKHDCFIVSSQGEVLADVFTIPNASSCAEHRMTSSKIIDSTSSNKSTATQRGDSESIKYSIFRKFYTFKNFYTYGKCA